LCACRPGQGVGPCLAGIDRCLRLDVCSRAGNVASEVAADLAASGSLSGGRDGIPRHPLPRAPGLCAYRDTTADFDTRIHRARRAGFLPAAPGMAFGTEPLLRYPL